MASFHDAHVPERTTAQGVQDPNAGLIHEETDVDLGGILKWFGALTITVMVTFLVVWGIWEWWPERHENLATLPSPVFGVRQQPPLPHLLPDPENRAKQPARDFLIKVSFEPQLEPKDAYAIEKAREDALLEKYNLQDGASGQALLPGGVVDALKS